MITILIVEDDPIISDMYKTAMEGSGMRVVTANNGNTGLTTALETKPDVILADLMIPGLNGNEMVERIRQDSWGKSAKVIFLTNFSDPENVYQSFKLNPEEYIVKAHTDIKEVINKVRIAAATTK